MSETELRELGAWIAEHVMLDSPRIEAVAMNADETGVALWENEWITRSAVRQFCKEHPQYHYVERKIYCQYTRNEADALRVLKRCLIDEPVRIVHWTHSGQFELQSSDDDRIFPSAPTLELAICLFAKQLFAK